jgi:O-glycosyl hydrolase
MLALLVLPIAFAASVPEARSPSACISIDPTKTFQEVDGFGCSEAFKRAEDVLGRGGLSQVNQSYVLDLLFDVEKGAGFTILRNGIGSTNNSNVNYMNTIVSGMSNIRG